MRYETYKQMTEDVECRERYSLQRINDLLDQIERLKAINAMDARQQIEVSLAIKTIYEALEKLPFG